MSESRQYPPINFNVALVDRSDRVRIDVAGPDRAKLLHNLTTNRVKDMPVGTGCEAFMTSLQGKTLAYVILLIEEEWIAVRTDPGGAVLALPHLRKYGVFEDVVIADVTKSTFEFHVVGQLAGELLREIGVALPEGSEYAHSSAKFEARTVRVIREFPTVYPGFTLIGPASAGPLVREVLHERGHYLGLVDLDAATFEVLRIEAGTPVFGKDITEKNLPQEIGRDARAINFVKGCYLGQETVARIDAVGHVNQILRGVRIAASTSSLPEPGWVLKALDKVVGTITSGAVSPRPGDILALAMVRTSHSNPGTVLELRSADGTSVGMATISDLPF